MTGGDGEVSRSRPAHPTARYRHGQQLSRPKGEPTTGDNHDQGTFPHTRGVISRLADQAGVESVGVYTLRHTAAVAWLEAGVHIKAAADLFGHSSIQLHM